MSAGTVGRSRVRGVWPLVCCKYCAKYPELAIIADLLHGIGTPPAAVTIRSIVRFDDRPVIVLLEQTAGHDDLDNMIVCVCVLQDLMRDIN